MSDPKIVRTAVISTVTEVHIYPETIQHIIEEHPEVPIELPALEAAVENAIVNPTHVEKSYNRSYVFVDARSTNWSGDPFRVPVKVVGDDTSTSTRMKTAYFATKANPEIIYSEVVTQAWTSSKKEGSGNE